VDPLLDWLRTNGDWLIPLASIVAIVVGLGTIFGWLRWRRAGGGSTHVSADRGGIAAGRDANVGDRPPRED